MKIEEPTFNARSFRWSENFGGMADASELGLRPGEQPFRPLYDDSADLGVVLRNPKTGNTMTFLLDTLDEGGWGFYSEVDPDLSLLIFND